MFKEWHYSIYDTPLGQIVIQDDNYGIARVEWIDYCKTFRGEENETIYMQQAYTQLMEYFEGKRKEFQLPLRLKGTIFQKQVWHELGKIPYGTITSFQQIAENIGNPNAMRAVGMANHNNPVSIIIPCHRVIGVNGKLSGYNGGVERKQALLDLEKKYSEQ